MIFLAIILYLLAGILSFINYHKNYRNLIILSAILLHSWAILPAILLDSGILFGIANSISASSLLIAILLFINGYIYRVHVLDFIIYPLIAVFILISLTLINDKINAISYQLALHIILSISAYAIFTICVVQSIIVSYQDKHLHNKKSSNFLTKLPPLQKMEGLLYSYLLIGTIVLSLALISGFVFLDNIFAQHLVHKTTFAIISWIIFTTITIMQTIFGLRGKKLIIALQSGFVLLVLSYFGSKFILEEILHRV